MNLVDNLVHDLPLNLPAAGPLDAERCYRAVLGREQRFDGWFFIAVRTTGIYCRPSCPTPVHPKRANVDFYRSSAAAQQAGFRACKRCRPDATPGSPEWNVRADVAARALRLINDGVIDRDGVTGLARQLHVSERQLQRILVDHLGAGPLALARAQRSQTARVLIETTTLPFGQIGFAAGFSSIRQFNDTIQAVFANTPRELRHRAASRKIDSPAGSIAVRLPFRSPLDATGIFRFLADRAIANVEVVTDRSYARTLRLPTGPGWVRIEAADDHLRASFHLTSLSDLAPAVNRIRRLFDLDADPLAVAETLQLDAALAPLVDANPGRRAPGAVDPHEIAVRAVLGQQVSVAAARTLASRLAASHGDVFDGPPGLTRLFPSSGTLASISPEELAMPTVRARALIGLCDALATGAVVLDPGVDRREARAALERQPGIGPWTAGYLSMRALSDPDVLLAGDLVALQGARALGIAQTTNELAQRGELWAPWRSYATQLLWTAALNERAFNKTNAKAHVPTKEATS